MTGLSDCILVMLDAVPFHGLMQRHQHLARELSRVLPVVYVEETASVLKRLFDLRPLDPGLKAHKLGLQEVHENLWFYKAPPAFPRSLGYRRSIENTGKRTARTLLPLLPQNRPVIIWCFSPAGIGDVGEYNEIVSVFDCFDAFGEFPGEEKYREEIKAAMVELAGKVDLVVATNVELRERFSEYNINTAMVQNGCDADHYINGGTEPENCIIDMDSLPRPIIGYMGDIAPWVELELLELAARRHPEWSVLLLGTWKRENEFPKDIPNIHAPGRVPYNELPYYARYFDVGTIPFELTELTRVVNPLKLYEYFALGIPIVATPLPDIARHEDLVYIAGSPDEFTALTEKALREKPDAPVREKRIEAAKRNSWKARGDEIVKLLEVVLQGKYKDPESG